MDITETIAEVLRLDVEPEESTWNLIEKHAYYRTAAPYYRNAAPALAREVQRLQAEVREAQTGRDCALMAACESGLRAGQEAMRERCMKVCSELILRARVCAGDDEGLRDLRCLESHMLQAIRALEVSHA